VTESAPAIGVVGNDVPRQLLLALGARPHRLTGSWDGDVEPAAQQLLGATDAVVARVLTEIRAGAHELDALVVCNDSQAHLRLFYVLRATAPELRLHLLDMPREDSDPARRFARSQLDALAAFCSRVTGRTVDSASLSAAAAVESALGDALQRLRARRRADPPRCSGTEALDAIGDAARLAPSEAVHRIDAARRAVPSSAIRVHATGSSHPDSAFYRVLEQDGRCVVVSEDHDTGDAAWLGVAAPGETVPQVLEGLIDAHFARVSTSATASSADRASRTREVAGAAHADVVAAVIRELDEGPLWDLADQRVELQERALISVRVPSAGQAAAAAHDLARTLVERAVRA